MKLNKNLKVVAFIGILYYLFVLGIGLLMASQQTGVSGYSMTVSLILQNILVISALLLSLHTANFIKTKFKIANRSIFLGSFFAMVVAVAVFLVVYLLLPLPLIDNRTAGGDPAFIDFESIWHLANGSMSVLLIFLASLFF